MKCPKCGAEHYRIDYSSSTLMHTYTEYNNGKFIHHDPNFTTDHVTCLECGEHFDIEHKPDDEPLIVYPEEPTYTGNWNGNKECFKETPKITLKTLKSIYTGDFVLKLDEDYEYNTEKDYLSFIPEEYWNKAIEIKPYSISDIRVEIKHDN